MKVLVGISGGVDSACAALKLKKEGYDVEAAVLRMHEYTDVEGAREVADSLGMVLHEIDMTDSFNKIIKENLIDEYMAGRTPNPCILCNEKVKFKGLYDFALENGFDKIATGHYARVGYADGRYAIYSAGDSAKDQSYMLYRLPQEYLSKLILPLSDMVKSDVRLFASENELSVADKGDSQEICFLPDENYADYIEKKRGKCGEGNFIDEDGKILGRHKGVIRYTIGQRKGLGISLGERVFVTDISPENNTVTLSHSAKGVTDIVLSDVVYSGMQRPDSAVFRSLTVKLRYSAPLISTTASFLPDGRVCLNFDYPVTAAPGQSAVIYDQNKVVCGGFINK